MNKNKLQGKDFITIGMFTAIYFVVNFIVSMLGVIPIFIPLTAVFVPLIGGIPMMLYFSKIKKPGMLFISGILIGLLMLLTGMGFWCLFTCAICALIAEVLLKKSEYSSAKTAVLAHGIFAVWTLGAFIPMVFFRESYYEMLAQYGKPEYAEAVMSYVPDWSLPVLAIAAFVFGIIGAVIGRKIFKKHFEKAGIM